MDRLLEILMSGVETAYAVFMTPGEWLVSILIGHAPSFAASIGISNDQSAGLAALILTILSWLIAALFIRKLLYPLRRLANAIVAVINRLRYRTFIALHGYGTKLADGFESLTGSSDPDEAQAEEKFSLNRLDMIILHLAKTGGPGFTLSATELAARLNLRPDQIQQSLDKLGRNKLLDFALGTTDGYETYRLNQAGSYILTAYQQQQAGA